MVPSLAGFRLILVLAFGFLASIARAQPEVVHLSIELNRSAASPGDQIAVAVILDHEEGWHTQGNAEALKAGAGGLDAIPTEITFSPAPGLTPGPVQWPPTIRLSAAALGNPNATIPVFDGRAIAFIPVIVAKDAPLGERRLEVKVRYQACDDTTCQFPETRPLSATLTIVPPGTAPGVPASGATFATFDASVFARMLAGKAGAAESLAFSFFGRSFSISTTGAGFVALLGLALLGGFLLNLTPCVLPVIPIKIMALQSSSGHAGRRIALGVVMFAGVVAFWVAIGAAIASIASFKAINQLFQYPAFSIGVGVFIAVMGVGMLGVFSVNLPQWVYLIDPKRESIPGSFVFGVMTAVLSTPCTAPFMGTAAAWAAKQPSAVSLPTFAAIGVGMGLPYLVLAVVPRLVAFIPKTGPASELIKQVMGVLMLAVAAFFVGTGIDPLVRLPVDPPIRWHWWLIGALVLLAGVWMAIRTLTFAKRPAARAGWTLAGLLLAGAGAWIAVALSSHGPIRWIGYTPERLATALAERKVVVLDFTAEWCINCKALEKGVLHQPAVASVLNRSDVVPMRVDLTGSNAPGQAKLKELNWVGIPLLAIFGPGGREPEKFDTYTPQVVLDAIARAGGKTGPS